MKEARAQEPVRIKKVGLENKKSASPTQVKTQVRPTVHPLTDKEIQVFRKKLKVNSGTMDSLPRSHNLPNSLLRQQVNERPPVTLSDLPYIGPVAAPLAQWAQSGAYRIFH